MPFSDLPIAPRMCANCPWNPNRSEARMPLDADTIQTLNARIASGEEWICHETTQGPRVVATSLRCRGARSRRPLSVTNR